MGGVKQLRQGNHIMHKGFPHRVLKNQIVVTGTHSHTKNRLELQNIFTGQKDTVTLSPHFNVEEVDIIRKLGQIIAKSQNSVQIMDMNSFETLDAEVDDELKSQAEVGQSVTYVDFDSKIRLIEIR